MAPKTISTMHESNSNTSLSTTTTTTTVPSSSSGGGGAQDDTAYHERNYDHRPPSQLVSVLNRPYTSVWSRQEVARIAQGKYATYWGRGDARSPLLKDPFALQMYTQMIQNIQPGLIVDMGTCLGGSALFLADMLQVLGPPGAKVVSIDIQDIRSAGVKAAMDAHPCILSFVQGDATDFKALVENVLGKEYAASSHPWIVSEDCHVDSYAVASALRLYGKPGDYLVFEDTHEHGPNISGMSAANMADYKTGFGQEKYNGLLQAMALLTPEFLLDTEYVDAFGLNATMQPNGVFRLCDVPETTNTLTYSEDLSEITAATIAQQLKQHGHVLFRAPTNTNEDMTINKNNNNLPFEAIYEAMELEKVNDYRFGTQQRDTVPGDSTGTFAGATTFDGSQAIYPHHELTYTPNPPSRIAFMCGTIAEVAGETTIFDGVVAWKALPHEFRHKIQRTKVVYYREMHSSDQVNATGNYLGVSWQDAFKGVDTLEEAKTMAESMGYHTVVVHEEKQILALEYEQFLFHETTKHGAGTALVSSVQANNAWAYKRMEGTPAINKMYWKESGEEVSDAESLELAMAYAKGRKCFSWNNPGDFVVLDNHWFAHGRSPFVGSREVFVTMGCTAEDGVGATST